MEEVVREGVEFIYARDIEEEHHLFFNEIIWKEREWYNREYPFDPWDKFPNMKLIGNSYGEFVTSYINQIEEMQK